ncbi:putative nuclease HARBI1-like protein [Mycena sanguinolenta]|uniref:Putative nuclease HARBI1-like protein n=1 Tax=Mycena sanguinolenta TaxID=230812 RepID=A0A8H6WSL4_9AGAR|nr:putative nuclease HARBI1-like protein [Mycena sanguinolenta]
MPPLAIIHHTGPHKISSEILQLIQRRRHALNSAVLTTVYCADNFLHLERPIPIPRHTSILTGQDWLDEMLNGHPERCLDQLGMYPAAFLFLCWEFERNGELGDSRYITSQEQTAIFLYWMVHGSSQRELMERFQRSNDTISKYTHRVLDVATTEFYNKYVQNPADSTPPKIANNPSYFPFFRHCRGAVDGVHVDSFALEADVVRYRDRHGNVTQNVLAACDFDMRFVYVMPGYEGTAADGRLFDTARRNGFALPQHSHSGASCPRNYSGGVEEGK